MKNEKIITGSTQVILASSSATRINILQNFFDKVKVVRHKVDEVKEKRKKKNLNAQKLVKYLAENKAKSICSEYKNGYIISCDQILECSKKIISKPMNLKQAKTNLLFLTGKPHNLFTCLYVIKNMKEYFIEETSSKIFFKKVSEEKIDHYIAENEVTTLSCVGSYKIEDNNKYKFLEIVRGDEESIVGFPIKKFIQKIRKEKL